MASTSDRSSEPSIEPRPAPAGAVPAEARDGSHLPQAERTAHPDHQAADPATSPPSATPPAGPPSRRWRRWLLIHGIIAGLAVTGYLLVPIVETMLNTVSTDDAYVNGHVTFVAPRVAGQVSRVLVDDNYRVKKGDLLVQLDKEPYQVQLAIKQAAVTAAEADLVAAQAQVRGLEAIGGSQRWQLQSAMEQVNNQIANLRANVATYESKKATLVLAQANLKRGEELATERGHQQGRVSTSAGRRSRWMRRPSIKPCSRFTRAGSTWAFPPSRPTATTWARSRRISNRPFPQSGRRCTTWSRPWPRSA